MHERFDNIPEISSFVDTKNYQGREIDKQQQIEETKNETFIFVSVEHTDLQ